MRRRRVAEEASEIPAEFDHYDTALWGDGESSIARWREAREAWLASQKLYPLELCDPRLFSGTGSEWFAARDDWEAVYDLVLPVPDWEFVPGDPISAEDF